jgi:hypothetical protein
MFSTIFVAPPPKKTLIVQLDILAVIGMVAALNLIANLFPPVSVVRSLYLNTDPSKLTTGVRLGPLCTRMRGASVAPAAVFSREQLRTVRFPVISIKDPSSPAVTSWQLSKINVTFSDVLADTTDTFVKSVAISVHSDAVTVTSMAPDSGAIVRAEKMLSL